MLIFQSEGLELDPQRRRHPMWEWLFSHPVPAGAIFMAEMLSLRLPPIPIYYSAPLFPGILYGAVFGWRLGILATFSRRGADRAGGRMLGKRAIEIGVIFAIFPPRSSGRHLRPDGLD